MRAAGRPRAAGSWTAAQLLERLGFTGDAAVDAGRRPVRRRAAPAAAAAAADGRAERAAARRADQRPRHRHAHRAGGPARRLAGHADRRQPRPVLPRAGDRHVSRCSATAGCAPARRRRRVPGAPAPVGAAVPVPLSVRGPLSAATEVRWGCACRTQGAGPARASHRQAARIRRPSCTRRLPVRRRSTSGSGALRASSGPRGRNGPPSRSCGWRPPPPRVRPATAPVPGAPRARSRAVLERHRSRRSSAASSAAPRRTARQGWPARARAGR